MITPIRVKVNLVFIGESCYTIRSMDRIDKLLHNTSIKEVPLPPVVEERIRWLPTQTYEIFGYVGRTRRYMITDIRDNGACKIYHNTNIIKEYWEMVAIMKWGKIEDVKIEDVKMYCERHFEERHETH